MGETTNVSLGLNLSANATSESPAQVSVKFESVANTTNDSVKFESVANTTNELPQPLLLVHGYQRQQQQQQQLRGRQVYDNVHRRRQGPSVGYPPPTDPDDDD